MEHNLQFKYFKTEECSSVIGTDVQLELEKQKKCPMIEKCYEQIASLVSKSEDCETQLKKNVCEANELISQYAKSCKKWKQGLKTLHELKIRQNELINKMKIGKENIEEERCEQLDENLLLKLQLETITLENNPLVQLQQSICAILISEVKIMKENTKSQYEATLLGMNFYKSYLNCHITYEAPDIYIFEFVKRTKKEYELDYYVKLKKDEVKKSWQFVGMKPLLPCHIALQNRLQESNDVKGLICHVREAFNLGNIVENRT